MVRKSTEGKLELGEKVGPSYLTLVENTELV